MSSATGRKHVTTLGAAFIFLYVRIKANRLHRSRTLPQAPRFHSGNCPDNRSRSIDLTKAGRNADASTHAPAQGKRTLPRAQPLETPYARNYGYDVNDQKGFELNVDEAHTATLCTRIRRPESCDCRLPSSSHLVTAVSHPAAPLRCGARVIYHSPFDKMFCKRFALSAQSSQGISSDFGCLPCS